MEGKWRPGGWGLLLLPQHPTGGVRGYPRPFRLQVKVLLVHGLHQAPAPSITTSPWSHQGLGREKEVEAGTCSGAPGAGKSKGPSLTGGERVGPSLLLCKVKGGRRWGVELHPKTGMTELSLSSLPTGSYTCARARTHTHAHTWLRHQTGVWGVEGSGGQDGRAGRGEKELLVSQCACHPEAPETPSLQHLPPGLGQLQGQRATEGEGS